MSPPSFSSFPKSPFFPPSFLPSVLSKLPPPFPFFLLLIHSFLFVLYFFNRAFSDLHCTPPPSIYTCSKSPHLSVTQLLVSSFWGALACSSKAIFSRIWKVSLQKAEYLLQRWKKKMSQLETQIAALCFKCYISLRILIKFVVKWIWMGFWRPVACWCIHLLIHSVLIWRSYKLSVNSVLSSQLENIWKLHNF